MIFKKAFYSVCLFCLVFMTAEILVRRWYWNQVPTQLPSFWVYTLVLVNLLSLPYLLKRVGKKKPERN